jgi:hypothetical protein
LPPISLQTRTLGLSQIASAARKSFCVPDHDLVYGGGILRGAPTPRIDQLASEGSASVTSEKDAVQHCEKLRKSFSFEL